MYCEEAALLTAPHSEAKKYASGIILEFWGRVTPGILQLLSHSKVVSCRRYFHSPVLIVIILSSHEITFYFILF